MRRPVPIPRADQMVTIQEAASSLRITQSLLYRLIRSRDLHAYQGTRLLLRRRDVDAYRRRRDRWLRQHGRK